MANCPSCWKNDKSFFAIRCPDCNTVVSFVEQLLHSTMRLIAGIISTVVFIAFMLWAVPTFVDWAETLEPANPPQAEINFDEPLDFSN